MWGVCGHIYNGCCRQTTPDLAPKHLLKPVKTEASTNEHRWMTEEWQLCVGVTGLCVCVCALNKDATVTVGTGKLYVNADSSFSVWMMCLWAYCSISQGFPLPSCTPAFLASHDEKAIVILSQLCFGIYPLSNVSGARKIRISNLVSSVLMVDWAAAVRNFWPCLQPFRFPLLYMMVVTTGWRPGSSLCVCVRESDSPTAKGKLNASLKTTTRFQTHFLGLP